MVRILPAAVLPIFWFNDRFEEAKPLVRPLGVVLLVIGLLAALQAWRATLAVDASAGPAVLRSAQRARIALGLWALLAIASEIGAVLSPETKLPFWAIAVDYVAVAWCLFMGSLAQAAGVEGGGRLRALAISIAILHAAASTVPIFELVSRGVSLTTVAQALGGLSILAGVLPLASASLDARRVRALEVLEPPEIRPGETGASADDPFRTGR